MCDALVITSMLRSLHMVIMFWSRTRPNGSGSSSNVRHVVPHSWKETLYYATICYALKQFKSLLPDYETFSA